MRLYHHNIGDLNDMTENVAYMSSSLMRENKHSEVLASNRNCERNQAKQNNFDVHNTQECTCVHTLYTRRRCTCTVSHHHLL